VCCPLSAVCCLLSLVCQVWLTAARCLQALDYAKHMGQHFSKGQMDVCWFEERIADALLAVLACEPVARACIGVHEVLARVVSPSLAEHGAAAPGADAGASPHAFERALVQFGGMCGELPAGAEPQAAAAGPRLRLRGNFAEKVRAPSTKIEALRGRVDSSLVDPLQLPWLIHYISLSLLPLRRCPRA